MGSVIARLVANSLPTGLSRNPGGAERYIGAATSTTKGPDMAFEPTLVGAKWMCPCKDAYGQAAELSKAFSAHEPTDTRPDGAVVTNFLCDQNSDRWQQISRGDEVTWHYLGRRRR